MPLLAFWIRSRSQNLLMTSPRTSLSLIPKTRPPRKQDFAVVSPWKRISLSSLRGKGLRSCPKTEPLHVSLEKKRLRCRSRPRLSMENDLFHSCLRNFSMRKDFAVASPRKRTSLSSPEPLHDKGLGSCPEKLCVKKGFTGCVDERFSCVFVRSPHICSPSPV